MMQSCTLPIHQNFLGLGLRAISDKLRSLGSNQYRAAGTKYPHKYLRFNSLYSILCMTDLEGA